MGWEAVCMLYFKCRKVLTDHRPIWRYVDNCLWQRRWLTTTDRPSALAREDAPRQYDGIIQNVGINLVISPTRHQTKIWSSASQTNWPVKNLVISVTRQDRQDKNLVISSTGQDWPDKNMVSAPQDWPNKNLVISATGQDCTVKNLVISRTRETKQKSGHQPHKTDWPVKNLVISATGQDWLEKNMGISPTRLAKQKSGYQRYRTRLYGQKCGYQPHKTDQTKIWSWVPQKTG